MGMSYTQNSTYGLIDSQRWLKVSRWLGIQKCQLAKSNEALAAAKGARYRIRGFRCWK